MRRMTVRRTLISGLAVAVALAARPAISADKVPNDRLLSPKTYLYLTIPSVKELKSRFAKSLTGQLLHDPKLADFLADVHKKLSEAGDEFQKNIGLKIDDVLAVPDGELTLAVLQPSEGRKLAVVGVLDFGKSRSTVTSLLEKASAALEKKSFKKSTRDFEGAQIIVYNRAKEEGKKDDSSTGDKNEEADFGSQFAYVVKDDSLIVATSVAAAQDVLRRWDGKHAETLAEVPAFKAIVESVRQKDPSNVFFWYVNPVTLVQAAMSSSGSLDPGVGMVMSLLPALGITNLKGIGGSVHLGTDEFDSESRTLIFLDQPASGLLNVFQFPSTNQAPPKWVTDDSTAYFAVNWDVAKAYSAVEGLVDQFLGPGATAQKIDELANQEEGPKIHLKKDVIDNLDGVFHVVTDVADPAKPENTRVLVAVGVRDAKKMKAVLEKVAKMPHFPGQAREFRGETIYNLEGGPVFGDANRTMGVAVTNEHLMFSTDVGRIEQVIIGDKDRKPLADSAKYKALAKHFPAKTSILGYQEQDTQMKALYEMLRSGKATESISNSDLGRVFEGIDFKKLPDFDAIKKYLPPSGSYAIPQSNGALFVSFTTKPSSN